MIAELRQAAETEVKNHSIFVWGGSGELCRDISEAWIRAKEAKNEGGKHADDAVSAWRKVMAGPYRDVARVFDCSGFVSWCLKQAGAFRGRTNCDGLFARCNEICDPMDGVLLFRVNPKKPSDKTHVGLYFSGRQYHAKGRKYGVVDEKYRSSDWAAIGWFRALKPDPKPEPTPEPTPEPSREHVKVLGKSVWVRNGDSVKGRKLFVVHKGDKGEYIDTAPSGWYHVRFPKGEGYITNLEKYTRLEG